MLRKKTIFYLDDNGNIILPESINNEQRIKALEKEIGIEIDENDNIISLNEKLDGILTNPLSINYKKVGIDTITGKLGFYTEAGSGGGTDGLIIPDNTFIINGNDGSHLVFEVPKILKDENGLPLPQDQQAPFSPDTKRILQFDWQYTNYKPLNVDWSITRTDGYYHDSNYKIGFIGTEDTNIISYDVTNSFAVGNNIRLDQPDTVYIGGGNQKVVINTPTVPNTIDKYHLVINDGKIVDIAIRNQFTTDGIKLGDTSLTETELMGLKSGNNNGIFDTTNNNIFLTKKTTVAPNVTGTLVLGNYDQTAPNDPLKSTINVYLHGVLGTVGGSSYDIICIDNNQRLYKNPKNSFSETAVLNFNGKAFWGKDKILQFDNLIFGNATYDSTKNNIVLGNGWGNISTFNNRMMLGNSTTTDVFIKGVYNSSITNFMLVGIQNDGKMGTFTQNITGNIIPTSGIKIMATDSNNAFGITDKINIGDNNRYAFGDALDATNNSLVLGNENTTLVKLNGVYSNPSLTSYKKLGIDSNGKLGTFVETSSGLAAPIAADLYELYNYGLISSKKIVFTQDSKLAYEKNPSDFLVEIIFPNKNEFDTRYGSSDIYYTYEEIFNPVIPILTIYYMCQFTIRFNNTGKIIPANTTIKLDIEIIPFNGEFGKEYEIIPTICGNSEGLCVSGEVMTINGTVYSNNTTRVSRIYIQNHRNIPINLDGKYIHFKPVGYFMNNGSIVSDSTISNYTFFWF